MNELLDLVPRAKLSGGYCVELLGNYMDRNRTLNDKDPDLWFDTECTTAQIARVGNDVALIVEVTFGNYDEVEIPDELLARLIYDVHCAFNVSSEKIQRDQDTNLDLMTYLRGDYPFVEEISAKDRQPGDFLESWNDRRPFKISEQDRMSFEAVGPFDGWDVFITHFEYHGAIDESFGDLTRHEIMTHEVKKDFLRVDPREYVPEKYLARLRKNYSEFHTPR
jgi:hypothetical protein